jgi:Fur family ferric uptake transcriptional regulator
VSEELDAHAQEDPVVVSKAMELFHRRLQEGGLKSTRQRDLIVERFFSLNKHISAEELLDAVREDQPRIGYATVYRTLKLLVEQGFAVTKDFGDGFMRYDPVHNDQDPHHDHLICISCRRIIEFNDAALAERAELIAQRLGFSLRRKKLELYAACQTTDCPHMRP